MDAKLEKDLALVGLRAANLNSRCQSVLALADMLNEANQLVAAQQRIIALLTEQLKAHETQPAKSVDAND